MKNFRNLQKNFLLQQSFRSIFAWWNKLGIKSEGKQYNLEYEFGGKVIEYSEDKSLIEIRNKLKVGDTLEILIPGTINNYVFKIEELWDSETDESIPCINPGKFGQTVKMKLPIECKKDWIIRRKKD